MDRYEVGMLARSKAGHDKGHVYIIMKEEAAYVYLVDGCLRPIEKPKKKKNLIYTLAVSTRFLETSERSQSKEVGSGR